MEKVWNHISAGNSNTGAKAQTQNGGTGYRTEHGHDGGMVYHITHGETKRLGANLAGYEKGFE